MPEVTSVDGETFIVRTPVYFRISHYLRKRVTLSARRRSVSRNTWITRAVERELGRGAPVPTRITAEMLLSCRSILRVRLDPLLVEAIDERAEERGVTRTTLLLDAILAELERQDQRGQPARS